MLSSFWFLIQSALILCALAFLLSLGGHVSIEIFDYVLTTSFGVFSILVICFFYAVSIVIRMARAIAEAPQALTSYNEKRAFKSGMQSLTYGLSAVAAGDVKTATYYAKKAGCLLKDDYGLVALLSGLTARLKGDEKQAETAFKSLLKRDETSFLGIRGLLQTALERGDYRYARVLARQAYNANPKQGWIIKTLYDLEIRHQDFDAALPLLKQAVKSHIFSQDHAERDKAAIILAQGQDAEAAYKAAPGYIPAILAVLEDWVERDKRRKALSLIKKTWGTTPHPKLLDAWIHFAPKKAQDNTQKLMAWAEDLHGYNSDDASANLYIAEMALRYGLDNQAKRFLDVVMQHKPTMRTYQLLSRLDATNRWKDTLHTMSQDKTWRCKETGTIFSEWQPFCGEKRDMHFNTIIWDYPDTVSIQTRPEPQSIPFFLTQTQKQQAV